MNRVQREKAGWRFSRGAWRLPRNRRPPATAPPEHESHREPGDSERGPEPPPAEPATQDES